MSDLLKNMLAELEEAARLEDHTDVCEKLKKLIEPLQPETDLPNYRRVKFTPHDKTIIATFWAKVLGYPPKKDTLEQAARLYGTVLGASMEPTLLALNTAAGVDCTGIALICKDLVPQCWEGATITPLPVRPASSSKPRTPARAGGDMPIAPISPRR